MFECAVASGEEWVNFVSEVDLLPLFSTEEYMDFVPDVNLSRAGVNAPTVRYHKEGEHILRFTENLVEVQYPWDLMRNGETLFYFGYPLIELQRQTKQRLTAHAACVAFHGRAILLLGKEGSGKTTTAVHACLTYGADLVANNLCILEFNLNCEVVARGGTKILLLRHESTRRNAPELLQHFPPLADDPWLHKVKLYPASLGIKTHREPAPIIAVYMVHVDETKLGVFVRNADSLITRLTLHENFSRYIRSTCTVALGGQRREFLGYIPPLDREEFYEWRKRFIEHLLSHLGITYISGPLSLVTEYIASRV